MHLSLLAVSLLGAVALAQNCGPSYGNQKCAAGACCSQYGWCDTGAAYCDPATCLKSYSGNGSSCAGSSNPYASSIPNIDVCGHAQGGVSCPGAGQNSYFYRCCSSNGHCGPKNNRPFRPLSANALYHILPELSLLTNPPAPETNLGPRLQLQDQNLYCGTGCQAGYGKCNNEARPPVPTTPPKTANAGDTCGPIVNAKCATGLCCSGSNFCGTGTEFCGVANWCQPKWGKCS